MCPPGTETAMLAARMRGPSCRPAAISSRRRESKFPRPPIVRIVVTPLISSSRANPRTMLYATARVSPLPMIVFTSFSLSRCFFCGLPLPARWTCMLKRPGIRYFPVKSTGSKPIGSLPAETNPTIVSPSTRTLCPRSGSISFVPSRMTAFFSAYFIVSPAFVLDHG